MENIDIGMTRQQIAAMVLQGFAAKKGPIKNNMLADHHVDPVARVEAVTAARIAVLWADMLIEALAKT